MFALRAASRLARPSRRLVAPASFHAHAHAHAHVCRHLSTTAIMSSQKIVFTEDAAFPAGPYSQAIKTPFAIFCSGQIPADKTGALIEGSIQDKTAQCIKNLEAVLTAGGSAISKVVKVNIFLADMGDFASMNEEYAKWFAHKPARSCVAVKTLPKNVDIEIECIALP